MKSDSTASALRAADDFVDALIAEANRVAPRFERTLYEENKLAARVSLLMVDGKYMLGGAELSVEPHHEGMYFHIHNGDIRAVDALVRAGRAIAARAGEALLISPSVNNFDAYWLVASDPTCSYRPGFGAWHTTTEESSGQKSLTLRDIMQTVNPGSIPFTRLRATESGWERKRSRTSPDVMPGTQGYVAVTESVMGLGSAGLSGRIVLDPVAKVTRFEPADIHAQSLIPMSYKEGFQRLSELVK